jgi:hypothetical protein
VSSEIAPAAAGAGMQGERPEPPAESTARQPLWHQAARWEVGLVIVLIGSLIFGSSESSTFDSQTTLFYGGINAGYISIMALPMMLIVVTAEIDLSVASTLCGITAGGSGRPCSPRWPSASSAERSTASSSPRRGCPPSR